VNLSDGPEVMQHSKQVQIMTGDSSRRSEPFSSVDSFEGHATPLKPSEIIALSRARYAPPAGPTEPALPALAEDFSSDSDDSLTVNGPHDVVTNDCESVHVSVNASNSISVNLKYVNASSIGSCVHDLSDRVRDGHMSRSLEIALRRYTELSSMFRRTTSCIDEKGWTISKFNWLRSRQDVLVLIADQFIASVPWEAWTSFLCSFMLLMFCILQVSSFVFLGSQIK
jgi:hypothetical protein